MSFKTRNDVQIGMFLRIKEAEGRLKKYDYANNQTVSSIKRTIDRTSISNTSTNADIDNLLLTSINRLDLPEYLADKCKYIMYLLYSYDNFRRFKYENVLLGCLMYCVYEDMREGVTVNFNEFIKHLYGNKAEENSSQMYQIYNMINGFFEDIQIQLIENN